MGGVWVRPEDHSTDVEGLYAIGEASSGLHGANRLGGNSLIELLVYGKIVGQAAAAYSARLNAQQRSHAAVSAARDEIDAILATDGPENVRSLQRALRNAMTEHAGVVRDEAGLLSGLRELAEIEERLTDVGVHPDIAGFYDLAHAFDLKASVIAARATLEAALERRETRGCHNRSDYRNSTSGSMSTWCGLDPAASNTKPFPVYHLIFRLGCVRSAATASLSNEAARGPSSPRTRCGVACAR